MRASARVLGDVILFGGCLGQMWPQFLHGVALSLKIGLYSDVKSLANSVNSQKAASASRRIVPPLVIVVAALFVYRAAIDAYFLDDDFQWLAGTLSFTPLRLFDVLHLHHFYRPVVDGYFAAGAALFGDSPVAFHTANILLHAINGLLVLTLVRTLTSSDLRGFLAGLFFVVEPADVDTIAWVSALAEAIGALFGCLALLAFVRFRRSGRKGWHALSLAAFAGALLTHESSVVFLPLLVLLDWAFFDRRESSSHRYAKSYAPFVGLLALYLACDWIVNRTNSVVTKCQYTLGVHALLNVRDYLVALYVGKGDLLNWTAVATVLFATVMVGSRRVKFATAWLLISLLPFVFFIWGASRRYLYLPSVGFSMLLAEAIAQLDAWSKPRMSVLARVGAVALVASAIAVRFAVFASANVKAFADTTEGYRQYAAQFRQEHPQLVPHSRVAAFPPSSQRPGRFLLALVQWQYGDLTIELTGVDDPDAR
jgi:hypothetical protein